MTELQTYLVPRWGGEAISDWYPAAKARGIYDHFVEMPDPSLPEIEAWTACLGEHLQGVEGGTLRLITHSIACHSVMRWLQTMPEGFVVREVVMVAAWWEIDRGFWESIDFKWAWLVPWMEYPSDLAAVRARVGRWRVVLGTGDALCPDYVGNAERWLAAGVDSVTVLNGRGHFNGADEGELFEILMG